MRTLPGSSSKISRRVIRKLRHLGYLEAGIDAAIATGYDPLLDNEPELAHTMAASVKQCIAFGERAGQKVRRIGSGFGYEGEFPELTGPRCASLGGFSLHANTHVPAHRRDQLERLIRYMARGAVSLERLAEDANGDLVYSFPKPWSDGTTCIKLSPLALLEKLAALVPLPRVHLVRYAGCLAPHSQLRGAIIPTPRQQGVDEDEAKTGTPYWSWARLLGRWGAPGGCSRGAGAEMSFAFPIREVVVDGETGYLVDPDLSSEPPYEPRDATQFAQRLAEALNRMLADPALRHRMGQQGRARVEQHYSWGAVAQ